MASACILASCAKVDTYDTTDPVSLGFDVYSSRVNGETKADDDVYVPTGTGHLPSGSKFGVFGFFHPSIEGVAGSWNDSNPNHPDLMYNQMVEVSESAGVYTYNYTPKRYWPKSTKETISFFAYYPYDSNGTEHGIRSTLSKDSNGMGTLRYTSSENAAEQVDFLVSDLCMDQSKAGNVLTGSAPDDEGKVRFTFHHMLSMVRVQVGSISSENPGIVIDEDSYNFAFYGFPVAGNCAPTPGAKGINGLAPCTFAWSGLLSTITYRQGEEILTRESRMEVPIYEDKADHSDFLLVIPHEVQDNERLEITFDLERQDYKDEGYSYKDNPLFAYLKGKIDRFEANKIYTFNITVGLNEIKLDASVTDWTTGSGDLVFVK